jgi:hypothetical protein
LIYLDELEIKGTIESEKLAEDAFSSMALDSTSTFAFVVGVYCPTLDFVFAF